MVKNLPANAENGRDVGLILGQGIPWKRKWHPTPVFLAGVSHGQRSLAGYSMSHKELDTTEQMSTEAHHCYCGVTNSCELLGVRNPKIISFPSLPSWNTNKYCLP